MRFITWSYLMLYCFNINRVLLFYVCSSSDVVFEDQVYLNSQSGSTRLDKFTHCFLVKCSVEV